VPFEVIVLGLASAFRPAGIAAITALLGSRAPQRSLLIFLVAGFAFSTIVGLLVVLGLHQVSGYRGGSVAGDVGDLLIGVAVLGFAAGLLAGRTGRPAGAGSRWTARLRDPSAGVLVAAGVATHLPGLFYLAALHVIVLGRPDLIVAALQVLAYNACWYSTGALALAASLRAPQATRRAVERGEAWLSAHERTVVLAVAAVVGGYFTAAGLHGLLT
jgi:hypothetical protein